jgi:hypothetical protein
MAGSSDIAGTGRVRVRWRLSAAIAGAVTLVAFAYLAAALPAAAGATVPDGHINPRNGKAFAPKGAPRAVRKMIKAGNRIRHKRYVWGGGHAGGWQDKGYDCSGAVSFVLHKAGLLDYPLVSGDFKDWGDGRRGKWVSIFASKEHVYMVVAGLRFDTSYITDGDRSGPGWSTYMRPSKGFVARHPAGL